SADSSTTPTPLGPGTVAELASAVAGRQVGQDVGGESVRCFQWCEVSGSRQFDQLVIGEVVVEVVTPGEREQRVVSRPENGGGNGDPLLGWWRPFGGVGVHGIAVEVAKPRDAGGECPWLRESFGEVFDEEGVGVGARSLPPCNFGRDQSADGLAVPVENVFDDAGLVERCVPIFR